MKLKVKKCREGATIPQYATDGSACFDLCACMEYWGGDYHEVDLGDDPQGLTIDTGLQFEIPAGYVMLVYSRSGHGFKNGVRLSNCVGVIDSDYRGELKVKLTMDHEPHYFPIRHGDRIAQAMVIPVQQVQFEEVNELSETVRGTGGFGSTGQ